MLKEAGARWIIVGHSERRTDHGESDDEVKSKSRGGHRREGASDYLCGRDGVRAASGKDASCHRPPAKRLIAGVGDVEEYAVIAYEPVWAIGTGRTPTLDDVDDVHRFIRRKLIEALGEDGHKVRILYGGSVKPENAKDILSIADVDGALVGGASLKARDFWQIVKAGT